MADAMRAMWLSKVVVRLWSSPRSCVALVITAALAAGTWLLFGLRRETREKRWQALCRHVIFMHAVCARRVLRQLRDPEAFFYSLCARNVDATAADGVLLRGWHIVAAGEPTLRVAAAGPAGRDAACAAQLRSAELVIIFFHGNGGSRGGVFGRAPSARVEVVRALSTHFGAHVLTFDLRGYGDSGTSEGKQCSPSEAGSVLDANAVYEYVVSQTSPDTKIAIYGQSLGTAIASRCAVDATLRDRKPAALILDAAFPSLRAAALTYPLTMWLAPLLGAMGVLDAVLDSLPDKFESQVPVLDASIPLLIFHKTLDAVIPIRLGRQVFEKALQGRGDKATTTFVEIETAVCRMRKHHVDSFTHSKWVDAMAAVLLPN
ncbi:Alpha/Beta hydrolase protein [Pelagophyceae sp. CCMP2097]|nr:Alpha/Beta hydrolase protein [Pelagophyceae sp. CCMP2097]